jgi:hypothetical protein
MSLQQSFILKALTQYNERVEAAMKRAMAAKNVNVTGEAARSIAYQVLQSGAGAESKLTFKEYLRFIDMGVGRGHPLGRLKKVRVELASRNAGGNVFKKDNVRKPKKVYSKTAYGELIFLENNLLHGYTEEAIANLKNELEQKNITNV